VLERAKARHYDHEVKGLTVVKPWVGAAADVPAEATVFLHPPRIQRGYVLSEGVNPSTPTSTRTRWRSRSSTRRCASSCAPARGSIASRRSTTSAGPIRCIAVDPDGAYKMAQLVRACRGLYDLTRAYGTPLVSGKDSMKNDSTMGGVKISVPPTLLVSRDRQIDDVADAVTLDSSSTATSCTSSALTRDETGGSEYYRLRGESEAAAAALGEPRPTSETRSRRSMPVRRSALPRPRSRDAARARPLRRHAGQGRAGAGARA
jgi:phosphoribosylformylglycinamidine synthase